MENLNIWEPSVKYPLQFIRENGTLTRNIYNKMSISPNVKIRHYNTVSLRPVYDETECLRMSYKGFL